MMNSSLLSLPDEILVRITEFTPLGDLRHLQLVCKRLSALYGGTLLPLNNLPAQQSQEALDHPGSTGRNILSTGGQSSPLTTPVQKTRSMSAVGYPRAYTSPRPIPWSAFSIPSPPSDRFAQLFSTTGYPPAGVRPPVRHHRSHSDSQSHSRYHSPSYSTHYAHNRSHHHVQPRVAEFHINPALAYPPHSHSELMYTHTKPILRNKGGTPPAPVHAPPRDRRLSFIDGSPRALESGASQALDGLTRRNPAPTKRVQFRPKASVRTY